MLTKEQNARIENLYKIYSFEIKPLTFYVERKYFKFPKGLLKEYRDVYDHLARCYEVSATDAFIEENLKKAENHFERIKLDIYKYACDYKRREFVKWKKKYSKYDMSAIDNGDFWKDVLAKEELGEHTFLAGRNVESKDINRACLLYKESFEIYGTIEEMIQSKRDLIIRVKVKFRAVSIYNQIIGFILGIAASIIASYIWQLFNPQ